MRRLPLLIKGRFVASALLAIALGGCHSSSSAPKADAGVASPDAGVPSADGGSQSVRVLYQMVPASGQLHGGNLTLNATVGQAIRPGTASAGNLQLQAETAVRP